MAMVASQTQTQRKTQVLLPLNTRASENLLNVFISSQFSVSSPLSVLYYVFQSFKRKPGQADNERSTGDRNERVNKRLRTVDNREERTGNKQSETQLESDLYEHIKQQEMAYDTQTYGQ